MGDVKAPYRWGKPWLIAAGIYNLLWGAVVIAFPGLVFDLVGMEPPRYPQIWQCVGMIVGVYGIGYLAASTNYRVHWPIILVGLLGKVLGPIGFAGAVVQGDLPLAFGATILTNDLIWWVPFALMLRDASRSRRGHGSGDAVDLATALDEVTDQHGRTLRAITDDQPTLVVLMRHGGCTFCKEAIADLGRNRESIERDGLAIAVVSMSSADTLARQARKHGLERASWVSDPERLTYRALEVGRGSFVQLFGPVVWWRGLIATLRGHVVGRLDGDGFQMPAAFVVHDGKIIRAYRHATAADRLDFGAFVCEAPA